MRGILANIAPKDDGGWQGEGEEEMKYEEVRRDFLYITTPNKQTSGIAEWVYLEFAR